MKKIFLNKVLEKLKQKHGLIWVAPHFQPMPFSNNPPKIFLAILSCHKNKENREACRKTWLSKLPENVEYRFFLGNNDVSYETEDDCIYLDCKDGYIDLPKKSIQALLCSLGFEYDWYGKCDDDSYVKLDRLQEILTNEYQCLGKLSFSGSWALGGAGYFMRRSVISGFKFVIVDKAMIDVPEKGCEDIFIGELVERFGYTWKNCDLLSQYPMLDNKEFISHHKLSPKTMIAYHNHL